MIAPAFAALLAQSALAADLPLGGATGGAGGGTGSVVGAAIGDAGGGTGSSSGDGGTLNRTSNLSDGAGGDATSSGAEAPAGGPSPADVGKTVADIGAGAPKAPASVPDRPAATDAAKLETSVPKLETSVADEATRAPIGGEATSQLDKAVGLVSGGGDDGAPPTSGLPLIGSPVRALDATAPSSAAEQVSGGLDRAVGPVLDGSGIPPVQGPPAIPSAAPLGNPSLGSTLGGPAQVAGLTAFGVSSPSQAAADRVLAGGMTGAGSIAGISSGASEPSSALAGSGASSSSGPPTPPASPVGPGARTGTAPVSESPPRSGSMLDIVRGQLFRLGGAILSGSVNPATFLGSFAADSTTVPDRRSPGTPPGGLLRSMLDGSAFTASFTLFVALVALLTLWLAGSSRRLWLAAAPWRPMPFISLLERPG